MSQGWGAPPPPVLLPPSRALALLAAAGLLSVLAPVLAAMSFFVVGFSMDWLLADEDACRTYACGEGAGFALVLFSLGWMCVMWVAGLIAAGVAVWRKISVARAVLAATVTAMVVAVIAMAIDWAWVVWSV